MNPNAPAPLSPATASDHVLWSWQRVGGMVLRYLYLLRASWTRVIEMVYWPTMQMILWGLMSKYLHSSTSLLVQAAGLLIAAVLLWDVLFRGQLGVSMMMMEEMYARNLGHLFISPLRPYEMAAALVTMSFIRTVISFGGSALLAWFLFHFSIFDMGFGLLTFFINLLIFSWGIGLLICGLLLRYGFAAESLAWGAIFALAPVSGIYYPIATLPAWLQPIAWALPSAHVFEGMRALMNEGVYRFDLLRNAVLLNAVYLGVGIAVFLSVFAVARRRGLLLSVGE